MSGRARFDALTDLPNRRAFFEFARVVVKRQTIVGTPLAALMIDVDKFKGINDSFGHDHGDMVLKRIADTILAEVTAVDAPRCIVARLGGEEFVVMVDGLAPSAIARLAERICNQVHRSVGAGERLDPVTVSVGVAFRKQGQGIDKLLKAADDAVYAAKRAGRDRWAFATDNGTPDVAPPPAENVCSRSGKPHKPMRRAWRPPWGIDRHTPLDRQRKGMPASQGGPSASAPIY